MWGDRPLKEWTDKTYRHGVCVCGGWEGAAAERDRIIEIILTSSSNPCEGGVCGLRRIHK